MSDKIRRKKVFISGPMSGIKDFNKPAFDQAEKELTECGLAVFNPAWMQFDPYSWTHGEMMKIDLAALAQCDYIYMLDGWEKSTGAKQEYNYAMSIGVKNLRKVSDGFVYGDNSFKRPNTITRIEIESFGDISGRNLEFLQWLEKHCNELLAEGRSLTGDILSWTTETINRQCKDAPTKLCSNCKSHYEDSLDLCKSCNDKSNWTPKDA
jgi:hypothetical protein